MFNDASRPASKANPHGISFNKEGEILFAQKVQTNNFASTPSTNALTKATNLMRKISTTQSFDTFHQASSTLQQFMASNHHDHLSESELFVKLAKNYILTGRSVSEMCEHNAAVAREYGKSYVTPHYHCIATVIKFLVFRCL